MIPQFFCKIKPNGILNCIIGNEYFRASKLIRESSSFTALEQSKLNRSSNKCILASNETNGNKTHLKRSHRIVRSQHPDVVRVTGITLPELLRSRAAQQGNKVIFESETGENFTYDEILRKSRSFANSLLKSGLEKGDIVAIALNNVPEYAIVLFGIWDSGLIATPVNPSYTQNELHQQIKLTNAKCIVTNGTVLESVRSRKDSLQPQIKSIIVVGEPRTGCHTFSEMIKDYDLKSNENFKYPGSTDLAMLPFSSGTTGVPKGVMLTHDNICNNMMQIIAPGVLGLSEFSPSFSFQEKFVAVLPFFHAFGQIVNVYLPMLKYVHTKCMEKYNSKKFTQIIREHKPTVLQLVSPMFHNLVRDFNKETMNSIHCIQTAATFLDPTDTGLLCEKSEDKIFLQNMLGMTETGILTTRLRETGNSKIQSVGSLIPGIMGKIVNVDSGETVGPFEYGELWVHGPQNFLGYYKNEDATRATIAEGNWVRTGDIAYFDDEECFFLVDRMKDIIKVKGFQVSPTELENYLKQHVDILDAAVVGINDKYSGQLPKAFIVPKILNLLPEDINNFMKNRVAPYKQLKGGIEFVDSIPRNASGKLLRKHLARAN